MSGMMINYVSIQNFKCHKSMATTLKSMNILTGINAAGKSSFIQAVLLAYKSRREIEKKHINTNDVMGLNLGIPINIISEQYEKRMVEINLRTNGGDNIVKLSVMEEDDEMTFSIDNQDEMLDRDVGGDDLEKLNLFFLNAERQGPRLTSEIREPLSYSVGYYGENTAYLICKMDREQKLKNRRLPINLRISELERFSANCEAWLDLIIPGTEIQCSVDIEKNIASLKYKNEGEYYVPMATGFGISYVFPVIVQALVAAIIGNSVLVIENPEAHLHPYSQSQLGKFLALIAFNGVQVIVETHSEHIIDGARIQAAKEKKYEEMQVLFFEKKMDNSVCTEIMVKRNGELMEWPSGFFDQKRQDLKELLEWRKCQR